MGEVKHTPTPWRVFTTSDGLKLVGIGAQDGGGILDAGFGVWSWNDPEGVANAELVVKAVNNHDAMVKALEEIEAISDKCVNAENYSAEDALDDLQAIRTIIKLRAASPLPDHQSDRAHAQEAVVRS